MYSDATITIPKVEDERGNLSFIEAGERGCCPFEIGRVYWIYDVPAGRERHGRALRHTAEMIVAMSGSFDVHLDDGHGNVSVWHLDRADRGLLVPPGTWRSIDSFSTNAVAMVLASGPYDGTEYIFDHKEFNDHADAGI